MENTLENKAKIFAQYFGQKILYILDEDYPKLNNIPHLIEGLSLYNILDNRFNPHSYYIELKLLSSISDEDAIELWDKLYPKSNRANAEKIYAVFSSIVKDYNDYSFFECQIIIDFLRSKGYALPYMGLSVEQQIEYGWVRLSE